MVAAADLESVVERRGGSSPFNRTMKDKKPKIFISGKMTGLEPEVYKANFTKAEEYLKEKLNVFEVINPCKIVLDSDEPAEQMLQILKIISQCEAVYFLDNWKSSNGSQCEYWFAKMLGIETITQGS